VLLFYFQAKKPEQFTQLNQQFLSACRQHIGISLGEAQHHLSLAAALTGLSIHLQKQKHSSRFISFCFRRWFEKDLLRMQKIILQTALKEQLYQVRSTPTDVEVHASLASTYLIFSKLIKHHESERSRLMVHCALEEFYILNEYASNDPWVHEQLAKGYHDLGMINEEIAEIELLRKLRPHDRELLMSLGKLYFQQGFHARGLRIYEELKGMNLKKAEELISSYGMYRQFEE
jgi:tetratricopeptide (TPR) repeat protein